jgi:hypothetical protein
MSRHPSRPRRPMFAAGINALLDRGYATITMATGRPLQHRRRRFPAQCASPRLATVARSVDAPPPNIRVASERRRQNAHPCVVPTHLLTDVELDACGSRPHPRAGPGNNSREPVL